MIIEKNFSHPCLQKEHEKEQTALMRIPSYFANLLKMRCYNFSKLKIMDNILVNKQNILFLEE